MCCAAFVKQIYDNYLVVVAMACWSNHDSSKYRFFFHFHTQTGFFLRQETTEFSHSGKRKISQESTYKNVLGDQRCFHGHKYGESFGFVLLQMILALSIFLLRQFCSKNDRQFNYNIIGIFGFVRSVFRHSVGFRGITITHKITIKIFRAVSKSSALTSESAEIILGFTCMCLELGLDNVALLEWNRTYFLFYACQRF